MVIYYHMILFNITYNIWVHTTTLKFIQLKIAWYHLYDPGTTIFILVHDFAILGDMIVI